MTAASAIRRSKPTKQEPSNCSPHLSAARQKALDLAEEIQDVIEAVPDMEEQRLLRLRYINGMKWEEVADAMGYSVQHIFRLHGDALISAEGFRKDESK